MPIDNVLVDAVAVATNNPFTSAFRGFGGPQAAFAYEEQMDRIAEALGMDRLELRRVNYLHTGDTTSTGQPIETAAWLEETATRALAALGEKTEPWAEHIRIGQGFASYFQSYGRITWLHDTTQAWVGVELDGTVVVRAGVPDLGAGQVNSLAQIAAEVLGVPLNRVTVYHTDTALTPLSGTSTATRQLYMSGNATLQAANAVRKVLVTARRSCWKRNRRRSTWRTAWPSSRGAAPDPRRKAECVPLADLVRRCAAEGLPLANLALFQAPFSDPLDPETGQGRVFPDFTFGATGVRGGGGHRDRRGDAAEGGDLPRRRPGDQPDRGRGAVGRRREPGAGLCADGGHAGEGQGASRRRRWPSTCCRRAWTSRPCR